jgi:MFS family permease
MGSALALGAILGEKLGSESLAGLPTTATTLGAAAAGIPLARLASARGRRVSLSTGLAVGIVGTVTVIAAIQLASFAVLLAGMIGIGMGNAVNLQARFAAADLSAPERRGRDISLVVWTTSFGTIAGPNLVGVGGRLGEALGLDALAGPFVIAVTAMVLAAMVLLIALRPDPLLMARDLSGDPHPEAARPRGGVAVLRATGTAQFAIATVVIAHALMVAVMAMIPVHMMHGGATIKIVGFAVSLHIAGMYLLSPVFGWAVDAVGSQPVIALGMGIYVGACALAALSGNSLRLLVTSLVLVGLGWSAATVGAATLLTSSVSAEERAPLQGVSDSLMSLAGAAGGAASGVVVGFAGFPALAWGAAVVAGAALAATLTRRRA